MPHKLHRPASLTLMLIALIGCAPAAQGQGPLACVNAAGESRFGVVAHLSWRFLYSRQEMAQALDMMAEAGIGRVRLNWSWKDMQPEPGAFHFEQFDAAATLAAERGIRLLPILLAVPAWASTAPPELIAEWGSLSPVDRYRPREMAEWLHYVRVVVERYDGDGVADAPGSPRVGEWEVWNEPNLAAFWPPRANAGEYVALLRATHGAIREADPTARVALGGLASADAAYLQALYAAGAGPYFDIGSVHAYIHPTQGSVQGLRALLAEARAVMDAQGDEDKPLWLTEIGWSDAENAWGAPTASQEQVAELLRQVYTARLPVDVIFWYNFRNIFDGSADVEHNFGLVYNDFTPKPAFQAYAELAGECGEGSSEGR